MISSTVVSEFRKEELSFNKHSIANSRTSSNSNIIQNWISSLSKHGNQININTKTKQWVISIVRFIIRTGKPKTKEINKGKEARGIRYQKPNI